MKKTISIIFALLLCSVASVKTQAQSIAQDMEQLELDYQKLSGLKSILKQMYQGYELVYNGYNSVKSISEGNYNLHQAFLNGLLVVSPTVRKYQKILNIISNQTELVAEYKSAYNSFKQDTHFNPDEISYMIDVYNNLITGSMNNLSSLTMVLSNNQLRMSDAERIRAIDQIFSTGQQQLTFLRQFNNNAQTIANERAQQAGDQQTVKTVYGIN